MMTVVFGVIEESIFYCRFGGRRKEILHGNGAACDISQIYPTPECKVNGSECYDG